MFNIFTATINIYLFFGVLMPLFSNISAISWQPVLVVEEAGVLGREPPIMGKQLVNLITCSCEASATYKAGCEPTPYW